MLPGTYTYIVISIVWLLTCGSHTLDDSKRISGRGMGGKYDTVWVDIILT